MINYKTENRIFFFIKIFIIFFIFCFKSQAINSAQNDFVVLGPDSALVKIKIFSSLTCPHCANFHMQVIPKIKKEYIDSGKVQLIFVDFPLDLAAFNASKLLHCMDENMQIGYLDTIYEKQNEWTNGSNIDEINNNLKKIVENLGLNSDNFNKCLTNEMVSDKILNGRINANQKYSINATPTIVINEKKYEGSIDFKNLKKKIDKLI